MRRPLHIWRVGSIAYDEAHDLQERLVAARKAGDIEDTMLLLEHPPTITLGRSAKEEHLRIPRDMLEKRGFQVHDIGRGGDVTYHGPGQLVGYPIIDLSPDREDVRKYVASLEETMIRLCGDHGIEAQRLDKFNGTWLEPLGAFPRKIGAVGVRISRWVTMHGFAFNLDPDLSHFDFIVPCGITDKAVTSLSRELEAKATPTPSIDEVIERAGHHFAEIHGSEITWHEGRPNL